MITYQVITPAGGFDAIYDDESPVEYQGDDLAISFFKNWVEVSQISGEHGHLLDSNNIQPFELYGFCQPEGSGIIVLPPFDELLEIESENTFLEQEDIDKESEMEQPNIVFDAVSGTEKLKLVRELGSIRAGMVDAKSGMEKLKLVKRVKEIRGILGFKENSSEGIEVKTFQIGDYVIAVKDVGFYGKDEMRINHIKTDYDSNKQMLKLEDKGSQYWNASDFKLSRRSDEKPKDHEPEAKPNAAIEDVNKVMPLLKQFIGKSQLSAVGMGIRGEEKQYFIDKMLEIANTIQTMPKTYGQDGMGDKAIAYLHYFKGSADWHITEKDMEDEQLQAFGLADLFGDGGELGYISIEELIGSGVELDFNWKPKTIGEIMGGGVSEDANIGRSWRDGRGDEITIESLKDGKYYALMNGKVNGGPIIPVDDLERFIELDSKQYQDKLRRDALRADEEMTAADEKLRKEKEFADVGGNPMQKGKAIAELSKMIRHNGVVKNKRQFVEDLVSGGENTSTYEEDKIKPMSGSAFFRATDQQQREHEKKVKEAGKVTRYMLGVYEVSKSEYDYANILIQKRDSAEESQEDGSTNINDMRGMSFAIERDGSILTSGAVPELADKNDPTSSFDYYKNLAIQMKGNLYIGDRNKSLQTTTDNNELIFGMTWGEIQSFQQGKSIDRSVISMLPENPILVYSSKGVDGSINASRSFLQSVVDGTADMDAETFPDQIEKAAEELGDGDVLVIQAANAYADYITKKSKELLS